MKSKIAFKESWKDILTLLIVFFASIIIILPLIKYATKYFEYSEGEAKFIVPIVAGFFSLAVTNVISLIKSFFENSLKIKGDLLVKNMSYREEQLNNFYEPLLNLMKINETLYLDFGPPSFSDEYDEAIEAAEIWKKVQRSEVLENNKMIRELIRTKMYLCGKKEIETSIYKLLSHVTSYDFFYQNKTEGHFNRRFPKESFKEIEKVRDEFFEELLELENKLKGGVIK